MAIDPTVANALLQSQLAMHAVNDPQRIAAMAASLGAIPPPIPQLAPSAPVDPNSQLPIQVPQAAPAPPAPATPTSAQAAAPVAPAQPPAAEAAGVTAADYPPTAVGATAPLEGSPQIAPPDQTGAQLASFGKALGSVAPPSAPAQPPPVHSTPPQQGSYNPAVVADFMAALMAAGGGGKGGGGLSPVSSLGKLIGG